MWKNSDKNHDICCIPNKCYHATQHCVTRPASIKNKKSCKNSKGESFLLPRTGNKLRFDKWLPPNSEQVRRLILPHQGENCDVLIVNVALADQDRRLRRYNFSFDRVLRKFDFGCLQHTSLCHGPRMRPGAKIT